MLVECFEHKLRIVLSETEMCNLFGDYDAIDYNNPKARKSLNNLINKTFPNTDFFRNAAKLIIEVHPHRGGCAIDLIKSIEKARRLYPAKLCGIHCKNAEDLIKNAETIIRQAPESAENSMLYKTEDGYELVLRLARKKAEQLAHRMQLTADPTRLAAIQEYEPVICKSAALKRIKDAFL